MRWLPILAAAVWLGPGAGALAADVAAVRGLLVRNCASCHLIPDYQRPAGVAELGAPPFKVIANDPKTYPEDRIRKSLRQPHWPMRRIMLSDSDIDRIVGYLASLRGR